MALKRKTWLICCVTFLLSTCFCQTVYAGSINGNEQSIISVAQGRFEKNGVVYVVKSEYISSLRSYLTRDDVDLTAAQAQTAISEIYANVQTGIESGYLKPVGQTSKKDTEGPTVPSKEDKEEQDNSKSSSDSKKDEPSETETNSSDKVQKSEASKVMETAAETEAVKETKAKKETKATPETEAKKETEAETSPAISMLELVNKAPSQTYQYLYEDTNALMNHIRMRYDSLRFIIEIVACLLVLVLAISVYKKLLIRHYHRKLRNFLKYTLAIIIAVLSCILCLILGVWFGAFRQNAILNKLADTGYYTSIYNDLKKDTSISFALLNIPDRVMDHSLTYEKVVIAARQQVENDLRQGDYKADTSLLVEPLKEDVENHLEGQSIAMTSKAKVGLNLLMERLDTKYTALLKWPFVPWWTQLHSEFTQNVVVILPISILLMVIAQILLVFLNHYKHRGFVLGVKGVIVGCIASFLIFTVSHFMILNRWKEIVPSYMNAFFKMYVSEIWKYGAIICGTGILLSCLGLAVIKAWKEGK